MKLQTGRRSGANLTATAVCLVKQRILRHYGSGVREALIN